MSKRKLLKYFIGWRLLLFLFLFLATQILPLQFNFLGGGLSNYLKKPYIWAWANFDGEHYLDIAKSGYKDLTYFYFPVYPLMIRFFARIFGGSFLDYLYSGLFVSNTFFLIGLLGLIKLVRLDYDEKVTKATILLLLTFPTSFYFGSVYAESVLFALVVFCIYFARTGKWVIAGILGALSTATKIIGLALFPALIVEALNQWKNKKTSIRLPIIASFFVLFGLLSYASFLNSQTGDSLAFLHSIAIFGSQRSDKLIFLPQVFYRYIFKVIPNVDYSFFPAVFTTWLEFLLAVLFAGLSLFAFLAALGKLGKIKIRLSYAFYLFSAYLIPTLSGSFSSLPRYLLLAFPSFILLANFVQINKKILYIIYILMFLSLAFATTLFVRGYWVS